MPDPKEILQAGFDVHVLEKATRPVTAEGGREALQRMKDAGAKIVSA